MFLLYYLAEDVEESLIERMDSVQHTVYFDEIRSAVCNFEMDSFSEGFHAFTVGYSHFKAIFPDEDYFITEAYGKLTDADGVDYFGLPNKTLIDQDYNHDLVLGSYFPRGPTTKFTGEIRISIKGFKCDPTDSASVPFYSRTQSPVFTVPAYPHESHFHSLFRSTTQANGYDVVLMNIKQKAIEPFGNFVLNMSDSVDTKASGEFILRSRYTRMGLSLYYGATDGLFLITNSSSWPVKISKRMFQYVPLRNFNGNVCNTSSILKSSASNSLKEQFNEPDSKFKFGEIVTRDAARKPKC